MVAGLRCRKNKTVFLLGMLLGKRWAPEELFTSEAGARPEANAILSGMTTFLQRSSSVANKCVQHKHSLSLSGANALNLLHLSLPHVQASACTSYPFWGYVCGLLVPFNAPPTHTLYSTLCGRHISDGHQRLVILGKLGSSERAQGQILLLLNGTAARQP